jgi:hypothetical protein
LQVFIAERLMLKTEKNEDNGIKSIAEELRGK